MPGPDAPSPIAWEELLTRLAATPRENGSAELHRAAAWLFEALQSTGLAVEKVSFAAHPYGLRLAGALVLAAALLYLAAVRRGRAGLALAVVLATPVALVADLDYGVPVFSWIGAERATHLVARQAPAEEPAGRLVFVAHYDTKTDLMDHAERARVEAVAPAVLALLAVGALGLALAPGRPAARRLATGAGVLGVAWALAFFAGWSGGAFAPKRSPGALDNGGSCAVLVKLAERLARSAPPRRTEVEILLLAAEEVGIQGSRRYVAKRFGGPRGVREPSAPPADAHPRRGAALPTYVVNLEGLGASLELGTSLRERFVLESFPTDSRLGELLGAVYRERHGRALWHTPASRTDAGSFLAAGIPATTLFSREPGPDGGRDLHSARDVRSRLDPAALRASVDFLEAVVRAADARPQALR